MEAAMAAIEAPYTEPDHRQPLAECIEGQAVYIEAKTAKQAGCIVVEPDYRQTFEVCIEAETVYRKVAPVAQGYTGAGCMRDSGQPLFLPGWAA